jgi:hypothetical protein
MTNGTQLPVPDLPTPITTPDPVEEDPSQLPVEPELDPANPAKPLSVSGLRVSTTISNRIRSFHAATRLRFVANRQFMRAATFRWPNIKASSLPI